MIGYRPSGGWAGSGFRMSANEHVLLCRGDSASNGQSHWKDGDDEQDPNAAPPQTMKGESWPERQQMAGVAGVKSFDLEHATLVPTESDHILNDCLRLYPQEALPPNVPKEAYLATDSCMPFCVC